MAFVGGAACARNAAVNARRLGGGRACAASHQVRARTSTARVQPRMVFGLGAGEIAVVAGVALLIFGPSKLAQSGKSLGSLAGSIKKASSEFTEAMQESLEEADKEIAAKKAAEEKEKESPKETESNKSA